MSQDKGNDLADDSRKPSLHTANPPEVATQTESIEQIMKQFQKDAWHDGDDPDLRKEAMAALYKTLEAEAVNYGRADKVIWAVPLETIARMCNQEKQV